MYSKYNLQLFVAMWMIVQHGSGFYSCPSSCKCHSRDVFCIGDGTALIPNGIPWNKTIVYVRNYRVKNETLSTENTEGGNNITRSLSLQDLNIKDIEDGSFELFLHVEFLNLNQNNLTHLRDKMFTGLGRLKLLHVRKNLLKEIDMIFYQTQSLFIVDFSYNNISNVSWIPELIGRQNNFQGYSRFSLFLASASSTRVSITLSNNPLNGANFDDKRVLRRGIKLILSDVGLQRVPYINMALHYLDLSHNNIVIIMPFDMLKIGPEFRYLRDLLLNNNNLSTIAPRGFIRAGGGLRTLYLENNALKTIPRYLPTTLYFLYMSNNQIKDIERFLFVAMANLNHLVLKNNKIDSFYPCSFCGLVRLYFLSLERNRISTLPEEGFIGLDSLDILSLSGNDIQRMQSGCFVGLRNLRVMELSFINNYIDIEEDVFDPLSALEELFIQSSPQLSKFLLGSSRALAALKNLRRFDISHNKILTLKQDISMFLPRLIWLDISGNWWQCNKDAELIFKLLKNNRHVFAHSDVICA